MVNETVRHAMADDLLEEQTFLVLKNIPIFCAGRNYTYVERSSIVKKQWIIILKNNIKVSVIEFADDWLHKEFNTRRFELSIIGEDYSSVYAFKCEKTVNEELNRVEQLPEKVEE